MFMPYLWTINIAHGHCISEVSDKNMPLKKTCKNFMFVKASLCYMKNSVKVFKYTFNVDKDIISMRNLHYCIRIRLA